MYPKFASSVARFILLPMWLTNWTRIFHSIKHLAGFFSWGQHHTQVITFSLCQITRQTRIDPSLASSTRAVWILYLYIAGVFFCFFFNMFFLYLEWLTLELQASSTAGMDMHSSPISHISDIDVAVLCINSRFLTFGREKKVCCVEAFTSKTSSHPNVLN